MMLTKKSRMTSLVAIAATVMLVFSTNVANAAHRSGTVSCTTRAVGTVDTFVHGSGYVRAPGNNWRHDVAFHSPQGFAKISASKRGQGGGFWLVYASKVVGNTSAYCITGNA